MAKGKGLDWMARLVFYGTLGICLSWLPVILAAVHAYRMGTSYSETFGWEWGSWIKGIEDSIR